MRFWIKLNLNQMTRATEFYRLKINFNFNELFFGYNLQENHHPVIRMYKKNHHPEQMVRRINCSYFNYLNCLSELVYVNSLLFIISTTSNIHKIFFTCPTMKDVERRANLDTTTA